MWVKNSSVPDWDVVNDRRVERAREAGPELALSFWQGCCRYQQQPGAVTPPNSR